MSRPPYKSFLTTVVGDESLHGKRAHAGVLLDDADKLAGRIAAAYSRGRVATVNFDQVRVTAPILHGDLLRLDGEIVRVGSSSMLVQVRAYRWEVSLRRYLPVQLCLITMVAISKDHRPRKGLPPLDPSATSLSADYLAERKAAATVLSVKLKAIQAAAAAGELTAEDVLDHDVDLSHVSEYLTMEEATCAFRQQFLPRSLNTNQTVFGGDVLKWMEECARATAKVFARTSSVFTIAMSEMTFKQALSLKDLVEAQARVVYVRKHALVVAITVFVERGEDGSVHRSHSGYFTVATLDASGYRAAVPAALDLSSASQDELAAYAQAKTTHYHWFLDDDYKSVAFPPDYNDPWPVITIEPLQEGQTRFDVVPQSPSAASSAASSSGAPSSGA